MVRKVLVAVLLLGGCNSVYISPGAQLDRDAKIYATRGGYSMRRSIKERMEQRGYNITVGKARSEKLISDATEVSIDSIDVDNIRISDRAKYVVKVNEREETYRPVWCALNGIWWWNFNVSIADQDTGKELMTWRGRGCAHSSLRRLDKILDKLEKGEQ